MSEQPFGHVEDPKNTILMGDHTIEATEDGMVKIDGEAMASLEDAEKAIHMLVRATISIVRGEN